MKILLVEDDPILGDAIKAGLRQRGFTVDWFTKAGEGDLALTTGVYDAVVLDINLPDFSGVELLKKQRKNGLTLPVIFLTAKDEVSDKIKGLDAGADDYLVKPFNMDELAARLRALLRRNFGRAEPVIQCGNVTLNPASRQVTLEGKPVDLSPKEFALLEQLLANRGKVLSKERIEEILYGFNEEVESNAVEVHIHHLRKKLGSTLIKTVRGVGYLIND